MTMKRRFFLQSIFGGLTGTILFYNCKAQKNETVFDGTGKRKISFGICSDVHQDIFYKVEERLEEFIQKANEKKMDFIIQLGDFCFPKEENQNFMSIWNSFNGPKYHVLGNHDMDKGTKEEILDFWGADKTKPYYSFDFESFHFIVLDPNNIRKDGKSIAYSKGNYFSENQDDINYIPAEQLEWLKDDLSKTSRPTIIFSHQPICQTVSKKKDIVADGSGVLDILSEANKDSKKVIACFSGHLHKNWHVQEHSIHHIQINSMGYLWVGDNYICETRYPREVQEKYPLLKKMIPYKDALYGFVELDLDNEEIRITGKSSEFIPPGPQELGINETGIFAPSPSIDSRVIRF
jgi:predicted MPP superfamily phosphohydrolase